VVVRYLCTGLSVDGAWFCSAVCVEFAAQQRLRGIRRHGLPAPAVPALRLGVLLLHQGAVTPADLSQALGSQRLSGRPLGAELLSMGVADPLSILRALAAQAGVNYLASVDATCVRNAPGGLSNDEVRALGVVPIQFHQSTDRLVVACRAPLPRAALFALRQLTGWTIEPLLVTDADVRTLTESYGTGAPASARRAGFVNVHNVGDAAAHIAALAATARTITLIEAHSDSATFVRVKSLGGVDTLFMRDDEENQEWQAATTLH